MVYAVCCVYGYMLNRKDGVLYCLPPGGEGASIGFFADVETSGTAKVLHNKGREIAGRRGVWRLVCARQLAVPLDRPAANLHSCRRCALRRGHRQ